MTQHGVVEEFKSLRRKAHLPFFLLFALMAVEWIYEVPYLEQHQLVNFTLFLALVIFWGYSVHKYLKCPNCGERLFTPYERVPLDPAECTSCGTQLR